MKKNRLTRLLAACLAVVCLVSTVAALSYDLSGDGKTNVWDLQLAASQGKTDVYAGALTEALGGPDELHPNAEGVYEICSVMGLFNMAKHATEGASFKLMNDIDMGGLDWAPVKEFKGSFDGNGKKISNLTITRSVAGSDGNNVGFFSSTANADNINDRSEIKDLNLVDVDIYVTDPDVRYVGGIVGTNRCDVNNCTFIGSITDTRTNLAASSYMGALVGRNGNSGGTYNGCITGSNSLDALEYYDYDPVENGRNAKDPYTGALKVNSQLALFLSPLEEGSKGRTLGIAGYGLAGSVPTDLIWQDTTNSSKYDDPELLERRTAVAKTMYDMSVVEWTPSSTLRYIRRTIDDPGTTTRKAGNVYRGLPYNHGAASLDRFLGYMETNADGRLTTVAQLPAYAFYYQSTELVNATNAAYDEYYAEGTTEARKAELAETYPEILLMSAKVGNAHQVGFNMYIGADCSSQAIWAWRTVNAVSGTDLIKPENTGTMYASQEYIDKYGIKPVNGFILPTSTDVDADGNGTVNTSGDKSKLVETYVRANEAFYMQTLSCVTKGDFLMNYSDAGGHTLVAMSDAVTIRNYNGTLNYDKSYIVTAEQGGSGGTRAGTTADGKTWSSTCCVDEVSSFNKLGCVGSTDAYVGIFFPITCTALQQVDTPAATATCKLSSGKVTSNYQIVSTTVNGETVYTQILQVGHRKPCTSVTLTSAHPQIATGDVVTVKLANGATYEFTY